VHPSFGIVNEKDNTGFWAPPVEGAGLEDWLDWLVKQHPTAIELGLDRVGEVWERLQPSRLDCPVITVGGTNGKGSCVAMLDAILRAAGYRTGCYTSPHLLQFNERIRIAGATASDQRICRAFEKIDRVRERTRLTYFEFATLAALDIFADAALDAVILEVGLGGRLDAVNILAPDVALVTTVDLDHTAWLGDDRERIGIEKAGIFRAGIPAVCGDGSPPRSLLTRAEEVSAPLFLASRDFDYRSAEAGWEWRGPGCERTGLAYPSLQGDYQLQNAAAVLMVLECLDGSLPVTEAAIRQGLRSASLAGRFQVIPGEVTAILDVAHNAQAIRALASTLDRSPVAGRTRAVFGMMSDKDVGVVAKAMASRVDAWYLAELPVERGMPVLEIAGALRKAGVSRPVSCYDTVTEALQRARVASSPGDCLLVFGSFLTVAEALPLLQPGT
jgi:dihydrofolate synthase/folylpolyglutamate synthase